METPVFVKIDSYKEVLDAVGLIKEKLTEAKDILAKITELKRKEDEELTNWNTRVTEVEEKIGKIDSSLFEPEPL